ncbi:MAG: alpha/beta hydrolase [Erysipelotrichaceae bacterium]|nr:alpha/beta hydrolase [Erysipelotrichaceae bacterium]
MPEVEIMGVKTHYEKYGDKGDKVLLLHGWGQNTEMMAFIGEHLKNNFEVYNIDFPGFGKSAEPPYAWDVEEHTEYIHEFCKTFDIEKPVIIAHSYGCRIAQVYASRYPVEKMVLTGAAGVRDKRTAGWYIRTYTYKLGKKILSIPFLKPLKEKMEKNAGSEDYRNASGVMRQILVKAVNYDTSDILPLIKCETLLVFGENDDQTPLSKGKYMEEHMPDAGLAVFENDDHFAYFHQPQRFNAVLDAFLLRK